MDIQIRYDETPAEGWAEIVSSWGWKKIQEGRWQLSGNCPRCGHYMVAEKELVTTLEVVYLLDPENTTKWKQKIKLPEQAYVRCNCADIHPDKASGDGCGQAAVIPFASNITPNILDVALKNVPVLDVDEILRKLKNRE
jgi:hypothetical protein